MHAVAPAWIMTWRSMQRKACNRNPLVYFLAGVLRAARHVYPHGTVALHSRNLKAVNQLVGERVASSTDFQSRPAACHQCTAPAAAAAAAAGSAG